MHTIAQKQLCTCRALYLECSWKCIVPKSLLSWNLSPESLVHSQSTDSPCLHRDALPLISLLLPCLPQRWIAPMVWLWYKVLPSSALVIWGHRGFFGTSRQWAQPSLARTDPPWFQSYMNRTEMEFSEDSIAVSAGLLQSMQSWLSGSLNRDTKVLFGMLVQLLILKVTDSWPGLLKHGSKG